VKVSSKDQLNQDENRMVDFRFGTTVGGAKL